MRCVQLWAARARRGVRLARRRIGVLPLLRLALLLSLLLAIKPVSIPITLGPPQHVSTTNPVAGVHTRLTDEVEAWKIQHTLRMVRQMGAPWIVEFFPWPYLEPRQGEFQWEHADTIIKHAENQGLTVIARLGWTPEWARPDPKVQQTTATHLDAERYDAFAAFAAAFAARYRGRVNHIIIWNEPNLSYEWGFRPVDAEAYVALLQAAYARIHAANPDAIILAGALAPTMEPEGSPIGLNDLVYLERMYQAGAAAVFDALAVHAYGLTHPPQAAPDPDTLNFRRIELLRQVMVAHGDTDKQVYVTEAGWNDHPRWIHAVQPAQRIAYTIDAYEWAHQHWPWCASVAIWAFRYPAPTYTYHDHYAFVTDGFEPYIIYREVQAYTQAENQQPTSPENP